MNIYDIAKKAGVSIATVSRVLNQNGKVSESTKLKVLSVIEEENFITRKARGIKHGLRHVGIFYNSYETMRNRDLLLFLCEKLSSAGFYPVMHNTKNDPVVTKNAFNHAILSKYCACIFAGTDILKYKSEDNDYLREFAAKMPIILAGGEYNAKNIYSIVCDFTEAIQKIVSQSVSDGICRTAFIFDDVSYDNLKLIDIIRDVFALKNTEITPDRIKSAGSGALINEYLDTLLDGDNDISSIIVSDISLCTHVIRYFNTHNISNISLFCCGNAGIPDFFNYPVSVINSMSQEMSQSVVKCISQLIDGQMVPSNTVLTASIITHQTPL